MSYNRDYTRYNIIENGRVVGYIQPDGMSPESQDLFCNSTLAVADAIGSVLDGGIWGKLKKLWASTSLPPMKK